MRPNADEIKALASASGKPLEVVVARAFLSFGHDWSACLGSYYDDANVLRELDVMAVRQESYKDASNLARVYRVRALISCRGFPDEPDDAYPLTFSVKPGSPLVLRPNLPALLRGWPLDARIERLGQEMGDSWIKHAGVENTPPLVAMDVIERDKGQKKPTFKLKGDRRIYAAIDSAVKAALYWSRTDRQARVDAIATLVVPICIFSDDFSDISIDDGQLARPELRKRAYQTNGYPTYTPEQIGHTNVTTLIATATEVASVVQALEALFIEFRNAAGATVALGQKL